MDPEAAAPAPQARAVQARKFLGIVQRAAQACGVTRLADITGLDRIGLPVWQAVRPAGRALSVHQGKGATALDARIGALCEAIESDCAERAAMDGPHCRHADLPPGSCAPDLGDYLHRRDLVEAAALPVGWCVARDLVSGGEQFIPHAVVSLDYTAELGPFDRSSSGLAVGTSEEEALHSALLEAIERDAVGEWERSGTAARMAATVPIETIALPWLENWRERLAACGTSLVVHAPVAVVGVPVLVCTLSGPAEFGGGRRSAMGSAAHADPATALFRAFAEAVQSRLTLIAGVRDDIVPGHYRLQPGCGPAVPPAPAGYPCRSWQEVRPGPASLRHLIEALVERGYSRIVAKRIGEELAGLHVAKLFVPGLGSSHRTRRPAR